MTNLVAFLGGAPVSELDEAELRKEVARVSAASSCAMESLSTMVHELGDRADEFDGHATEEWQRWYAQGEADALGYASSAVAHTYNAIKALGGGYHE